MVKVCTKCKVEKPFDEFGKNKKAKDGLNYNCKSCCKEYRQANKEYYKEYREANKEYGKEYREANRERIKERMKEYGKEYRQANKEYIKEYREANKEYIKELNKKHYRANKEKIKEYRQANKEIIKEKAKKYYQANKQNIKERTKEYKKERRKTDPLFKMKCNLRSRTSEAFKNKGYSKNTKTQEILGVDWEIAKQHIERQFTKGMNWNNQGEWHIDHIIPLASAITPERLKELCHYTNLQPLWAEDNLSKSDKIIEQQTLLRI